MESELLSVLVLRLEATSRTGKYLPADDNIHFSDSDDHYRTSYIVTCVFTFITAAVIAEICSSLPAAGSIYLWAAEAGGPKYGRLFGIVVAWWSTTAWTTFCASKKSSPLLSCRFNNFRQHARCCQLYAICKLSHSVKANDYSQIAGNHSLWA